MGAIGEDVPFYLSSYIFHFPRICFYSLSPVWSKWISNVSRDVLGYNVSFRVATPTAMTFKLGTINLGIVKRIRYVAITLFIVATGLMYTSSSCYPLYVSLQAF